MLRPGSSSDCRSSSLHAFLSAAPLPDVRAASAPAALFADLPREALASSSASPASPEAEPATRCCCARLPSALPGSFASVFEHATLSSPLALSASEVPSLRHQNMEEDSPAALRWSGRCGGPFRNLAIRSAMVAFALAATFWPSAARARSPGGAAGASVRFASGTRSHPFGARALADAAPLPLRSLLLSLLLAGCSGARCLAGAAQPSLL